MLNSSENPSWISDNQGECALQVPQKNLEIGFGCSIIGILQNSKMNVEEDQDSEVYGDRIQTDLSVNQIEKPGGSENLDNRELSPRSSLFNVKTLSTLKNLQLLNLTGNLIGFNGLKFIAQNSNWTTLEVLVLNRVGLDYRGAAALAENASWERLQELYLDGNPESR